MSAENIFIDAESDNSENIGFSLEENSPDEQNEVGLTGLQICASNGCLNSAAVYLQHGASMSHVDRESRWTALHRSVYGSHIKVSMLLTKAGAALDGEEALQDKEGLTPMDLLSMKLSPELAETRSDMKSSAVWSFGKSDFILGVPLPKASEVVQPRRIDNLADKCVVQTCVSKYHSCALTSEGDVYSWGHGRSGRLGHASEVGQPEPLLVSYFKLKRVLIRQIASGENHTVVVSRQGDVYTWGSDKLGQLGHGNTLSYRSPAAAPEPPRGEKGSTSTPVDACSLVPKRVDALRREFVLEVAAGDGHCLCHTRDGSLYAWGSNKSGQLGLRPTELNALLGGGHGVNIPKKVHVEALSRGRSGVSTGHGIPGRIVQIAASHNNSMLLCFSNTATLINSKVIKDVYQWGHGIFSPVRVVFKEKKTRTLSLGEMIGQNHSAFKPVGHSGLVNIIQVAPGQHHFAGLSSDGCVYTWGMSSHAGVGAAASIGPERLEERVDERVEGRESISLPRLVDGMLSEQGGGWVVSIAAASNRICAVTDVGKLYTWSTTLGKSAQDGETVPRRVATVKRAVAVSAAVDHTLVLCGYTLPALPLAASPMFVDCCPQTGRPLLGARESTATTADGAEDERCEEGDSEAVSQSRPSAVPEAEEEEEGEAIVPSPGECEEEEEEEEEECSSDNEPEDENLPSLMNLCQREVAKSVTLKTAISALSFAEQFSAQLLAEYCHDYISKNFDAVLAQTKTGEIEKYVDSWGFGDIACKPRSGSTLGLPSSSSKARHTAANAAERPKLEFSSAKSGASKKELPSTTEDVRKQMRAVKKKLGAIAELEGKVASEAGFALSAEQREKVSKKQELFAEYAHLEQLLVRCEARERVSSSPMPTEEASRREVSQSPPKPTPVVAPVSFPVAAPAPEATLSKTTTTAVAAKDTTPAKKSKGKGISLKEFNMIVESTGGRVPADISAWGRPVAEVKPPAPVRVPVTDTATAGKNSPWGGKSVAQAPTRAAVASPQLATSPPPPIVLNLLGAAKTATSDSTRPRVTAVSTPTQQPACAKDVASPAAVTTLLGAPRRTRALMDFLPSAKQTTPVTPQVKAGGWAASPTPPPSTCRSAPPAVAVAAAKPVRFSDIQRTEESARKASSITALQGNSSPWYVERRQRADSMEEVVRQQAWDRAEEEEIARAVAEIDRIALLAENAAKAEAAKAEAAKAEGSKKKKGVSGNRPGASKKKLAPPEKK